MKLKASSDLKKKFGFALLISTVYYVFAFMLVYLVYQSVTILLASAFNIPVIWSYSNLKFILSDFSPLYSRSALIIIFASGPFVSLLLAFVFLTLYFSENTIIKRFQLFYLWGFICGCNMFFGSYIAGFLTRTEFIYSFEWMFMSRVFDIMEIIFLAISIVMLIIIGRAITPLFLISSGSVTLVKPEFRIYYILGGVIFPCVAGIAILFLLMLPTVNIPLIIKTVTPVFILMPSLLRYNLLKYDNIYKSGLIQHHYFRWSIIAVIFVFLFFYRLILNHGLKIS